jgi:DNA sulfur modification protein DndE
MSFNRVRISQDATTKLDLLKKRTGLTPNILCRLAFCLSLNEPGLPALRKDSSGQEFNRYILTAEWDPLYMSLMKLKRKKEDAGEEDPLLDFRNHIERGVPMLFNRVRKFTDLADLLKN